MLAAFFTVFFPYFPWRWKYNVLILSISSFHTEMSVQYEHLNSMWMVLGQDGRDRVGFLTLFALGLHSNTFMLMKWNVHHKSRNTVLILLLCPQNAKGRHKHILKGCLNWVNQQKQAGPALPPPWLSEWSVCLHHLPYLGRAYLFGMWILPHSITIFKWDLCRGRERDLFFTVYL